MNDANHGLWPPRQSKLLGLGHYLPRRVVTNEELFRTVGVSPEEIRRRTGVEERRFIEPGESCSELAYRAVVNMLQKSGVRMEDIDCIVFATLSPDHFFPGSGCFLQEKLGLVGIPALDIRGQCSGFLYGLAIADSFVRLGTYQRVLVVGSEIHSTGLNFGAAGRDLSILFGDGAACAILGPSDGDSAVLATRLHADGRYARELWVESPSSSAREQISHADIDRGAHYPHMNGGLVFRQGIRRLQEVIRETVSGICALDDISLFVFHQANIRIIQMVVKRMGIPSGRVFNTISRYGNTTAASIPISLSEAIDQGRLQRGDLLMLASFGAGFTWGGVLIRY